MPYSVIRSKRKTISLEFDDQAKLVVKAPTKTKIKHINDFVKSKHTWIIKTQQKLEEKKQFTNENYSVGGQILFLGKRLTIEYNKKQSIDLINNKIYISSQNDNIIKTKVEKLVRKQAEQIFQHTLDEMWNIFSTHHSHQKPNLKIRLMKRQWGNLKHTKPVATITLNLNLVKTPHSCIESVVMHELCHLEHQNHQKQFYNLLLGYMPDYRARRKSLCKYG